MKRVIVLLFLFFNITAANYAQCDFSTVKLNDCLLGSNNTNEYWHQLVHEHKYEDAAAILEYAVIKDRKLQQKKNYMLYAGQLRALAGQYDWAKSNIKSTYSVFSRIFDNDVYYYHAKGIVAFLNNDRAELQQIIKIWTDKYPQNKAYSELVNLLANWGEDYATACKV